MPSSERERSLSSVVMGMTGKRQDMSRRAITSDFCVALPKRATVIDARPTPRVQTCPSVYKSFPNTFLHRRSFLPPRTTPAAVLSLSS